MSLLAPQHGYPAGVAAPAWLCPLELALASGDSSGGPANSRHPCNPCVQREAMHGARCIPGPAHNFFQQKTGATGGSSSLATRKTNGNRLLMNGTRVTHRFLVFCAACQRWPTGGKQSAQASRWLAASVRQRLTRAPRLFVPVGCRTVAYLVVRLAPTGIRPRSGQSRFI